MAWADEVVKDGRGRAIRLDFSTDRFSTVSMRVASVAGKLDGTNWYDERVARTGRISRALGEERVAAGAKFDVQLSNPDGYFDTWFDREEVNTTWKLRCRLYITLFEPPAPTSFASKMLGDFAVRSIRRNNSTVSVDLEDDILASMPAGIETPTIQDWMNTGTAATNPLLNTDNRAWVSFPPGVDEDTPLPLLFGEDWHPPVGGLMGALRRHANYQPAYGNGRYREHFALPICATRSTGSFTSEIQRLFVDARDIGFKTMEFDISTNVFTTQRSATITKNGDSWQVIYVLVDIDSLIMRFSAAHGLPLIEGRDPATGDTGLTDFGDDGRDLLPFFDGDTDLQVVRARWFGIATRLKYSVRAGLFSGYTSSPTFYALDVVRDLREYYTKNPPALDTDSFGKEDAAGWGRTASGSVASGESIRSVLSKIAQSFDSDFFINWDGELAVSGNSWTEELAAEAYATTKQLPTIYEHEISDFEEWFPEPGERGAYANSYSVEGAKTDRTDPEDRIGFDRLGQGPYIFTPPNDFGVTAATRIIPGVIQMGWLPRSKQRLNPFTTRRLQFEVVPRIRFRTALHALRLDLGGVFYFQWSRGVSPAAYENDLFQVEGISWDPATDSVEIEAVFRRDLSRMGYILDNQAFRLITSDATFAGDPRVQDASTTVSFTAGNLTSAGVLAGDALVLLDATLAAGIYTRFRALRIASVDSATALTIASDDLDFDAASLTTVTTWKILRGSVTDMTGSNYTAGDYYGKASTNADQDSAGDPAGILDGG